MTMQEIKKKFAEIDDREAEEPTAEDLSAFVAAEDEETVSLREFQDNLEQYSGKVIVRIPRSLHKQLKEAAQIEGVSLNQYMLYKLSR